MEDKIELLRDMVAQSDNIVFFGGACFSTDRGVPEFSSVDGLYLTLKHITEPTRQSIIAFSGL